MSWSYYKLNIQKRSFLTRKISVQHNFVTNSWYLSYKRAKISHFYLEIYEKSMIFMELNIQDKKSTYKTCKLSGFVCLKYFFQKMSPEVIQVLRMSHTLPEVSTSYFALNNISAFSFVLYKRFILLYNFPIWFIHVFLRITNI